MNIPVIILGIVVGGFGVLVIVRGGRVGAKRPRTLPAWHTRLAQLRGWTFVALGAFAVATGVFAGEA